MSLERAGGKLGMKGLSEETRIQGIYSYVEALRMEKTLPPFFKLRDLMNSTTVPLHILVRIVLMAYFVFGNHFLCDLLQFCTRKVRILPDLNGHFSPLFYSLGFEPKENKYKVLLTICHVREGY
ncbi:hypothetical protein H5410_000571 [Solanum commersonii]|uniref:Uncharacterized protein n=1 Tax=Solanum commersonii TaxID=4109 RepID=A0A9J6AWE7_SOLCO|nr:hypothetical protein H5410_000571 [Solanum commersonii]